MKALARKVRRDENDWNRFKINSHEQDDIKTETEFQKLKLQQPKENEMELKTNEEPGKLEFVKTGSQYVSLQAFGPKPNARKKARWRRGVWKKRTKHNQR